MQLSQRLVRKLEEAGRHEHFGRYDRAERSYQEILEGLDPDDKVMLGTIYNNLGVNATNALDAGKGIAYFSKAIRQLDGLKGEAMLQNAHAHWNIARLYVLQDNPDAARFAERALELYTRYPFTTELDLADAHICLVLSHVVANRSLTAETLSSAWARARAVPFESLNSRLAVEFLSLLLTVAAGIGDAGIRIRRQAEGWAEPGVFSSVARSVDRGGR